MSFSSLNRRCFRLLRATVIVGALCLASAVFGDEPAGPPIERTQKRLYIVGAPADSYPYGYTKPDGMLAGFTADLLDAVARAVHLEIQRVGAPGIEIHRRFSEGEFDLLQTYSQTPSRDGYTDFSVPFLTLQGAIFVQKNSPVKKITDLNGRKFAIIGRGSMGERFLRDQGIRAEAVYMSSSEEALAGIEKGLYAGTFVSQLTALSLIERNGLRNVAMLGEPYADYDIRHCFAVHKGNTQLLARLNEGLAILNRTGEFQKIYDHWFGKLEPSGVSKRILFRYAVGGVVAIALLLVAGFLHRRFLKRLIDRQTEELSAQQAQLHALYDNIPMAICLLERDSTGLRILSVNRQAEPWIGASASSIKNQYLHQLPKSSEWTSELISLLAARGDIALLVRTECRLPLSEKRIIFTLVPMPVTGQGHPRLCVLGEDITERRSLDEEISQSRRLRAIGELVGGIAHEFNNLLTPIALKTSEIQLDWPGDARLHSEIQLISDAAQRASELTRRLLTFGRKADNRVEQIYLGSIANACLALLKLTVDRRIAWENAIPNNLPPLSFNPTDLNQIILNLVLNARDTLVEKLAGPHPEGWTPTIRVEATQLPVSAMGRLDPAIPSRREILSWQRLTIRDNGMGMTPEVRERVFEPFYTTKDVGKGTGLGLATVWHLVTEVSGRVEVESLRGEGSAFHVYLPVYASQPAPEPAPQNIEPLTSHKSTIFLAEDDEMVATSIVASLRRAGHKPSHEPNGMAAWKHLQEKPHRYDLIILDVNMPGMDGIELARRIRGAGAYKGRIMIISGRLSSEDLCELTEAKVDRVLSKPFQIAEFLSAVNDCLALDR